MNSKHRHLENLIQSVQLLALEYEAQINLFPDFVHVPDELALIFSDCNLFLKELIESGLTTEDQASIVKEIDYTFETMNDKKRFWTLEALEKDSEWQNIRSRANELLISFGRQKQQPDLNWIKYIKGDIE